MKKKVQIMQKFGQMKIYFFLSEAILSDQIKGHIIWLVMLVLGESKGSHWQIYWKHDFGEFDFVIYRSYYI